MANDQLQDVAGHLLRKRAEVLGRPLSWAEAVEITALVTSMSDKDKQKLLALDDAPQPVPTAGHLLAILDSVRLSDVEKQYMGPSNVASWNNAVTACCVEIRKHLENTNAAPAAQDVAGLFSTSGNEGNWPRIGEKYLVRINGVLQEETFEFDQSDDGMGGGEYFWSRPDCDERPAFDPARDEWLAIDDLEAAHQSGGAK